jgi:16S rRNA processing protein RimM
MAAARPGGTTDRSDVVVLGRVGAPFGVRGWVKVSSYTDPVEGIADYPAWTLVQGGAARTVEVLDSKLAGRGVAVQLAGIETIEAARALTGAEIQVDRAVLPPVEAGEFYLHDLLGLQAVNREGQSLGQVDSFLELPAHPVVVLRGERERLVPLVPERIVEVDLEARRITLDWHVDD